MADDKKEEEMKQEITSYLKKKEYYDIMGVEKTASETEIKKAYRAFALKFHPDKNKVEGNSEVNLGAMEVFKNVSHAYSVLIDAEKRSHYDRDGPEDDGPRPRNRAANPQEDY